MSKEIGSALRDTVERVITPLHVVDHYCRAAESGTWEALQLVISISWKARFELKVK